MAPDVIMARRRAVLTLDREKYKEHVKNYSKYGYYSGEWHSDKFIDMMIHKEVYFMRGAPQEKRKVAEEWLVAHGYSLDY